MTSLIQKIAEYVELSEQLRSDLYSRLVASEQRAEDLQKQASEPLISTEKATQVTDRLIKANLLSVADKEACVQRIGSDPEVLLAFIDKLAGAVQRPPVVPEVETVPPMGAGYRSVETPALTEGPESDRAYERRLQRLRSMQA